MNKFKKILLGVASGLTLGALLTVSTVKINAGTVSKTEVVSSVVLGEKYTLNSSTVIASNTTIDGNTDISGYYDIFSLTGSKWIIKGSNKLASNGDGGNDTQKCRIKVSLGSNQTISWEMSAIASGDNIKASSIIVNGVALDSSVTLNKLGDGTDLSGSYTNGTNSTIDFIFYFKNKTGFNSISATITEAATYSLSYENNGHGLSQSSVSDIASIPTLPILSEDGWRFDGWFYDDEKFEQPVTAGDSISSDTIIYAKWTDMSSTWNVTFKKYSTDTDPYATVSVPQGDSIVSEDWPTSPRVLNKSFVGWYDGDTEYTQTSTITANTTLVAKFTELKNDLVVFGDYTTGLSTTATTATHNFIDGVDASGSSNKKIGEKSYTIGDVAFNGTANSNTFVQCGEITFTLSSTSMVTFYATQTGNKDTNNATTYVINTATNATVMESFRFDLKASDSSTLITAYSVTLPAGTYKTVQSGLQNWYGIRVNQDIKAIGTTASVFAEKNAAGDTLRFVGTLTGITSLDDISSVELVLKKGGVASKKQIFLTTCYTSVTGTSQTCAQADNTYYVIYRLNGIKEVTGSFTKQLVITFTDGSTTSSEVTDFSL